MARPTTLRGSKLLIQIGDGLSPETFVAPCALTTKSFSRQSETSDFNVADCDDPDAPIWVERVKDALNSTITGSGLLAAETIPVYEAFLQEAQSRNVRIVINFEGAPVTYNGSFHLVSFNVTGEQGGMIEVELEMRSNGAVERDEPEAETTALIARMTTAPSFARAATIDTLVAALKSAGVWTKLDALYVMAAHDAQAARLNWVQNAFNLSAVSAPTFLADHYYQGNGSSSYLDSAFDPTTAPTPHFAQNDAHMGVWQLSNTLTSPIGSTSVTIIPSSGTNHTLRLNAATGLSISNPTATGYFAGVRRNSSDLEAYRNGASLGTGTVTSTSPGAEAFYIGARNQSSDSFSAGQISLAHWGSQLSTSEVLAAYNAFAAYLASVGAV